MCSYIHVHTLTRPPVQLRRQTTGVVDSETVVSSQLLSTEYVSRLPRGPIADACVATGDGFGAGHGSLSPTSSVADLRPNRDAAVGKFSVSISSFLIKMGSWERPLQEAPG